MTDPNRPSRIYDLFVEAKSVPEADRERWLAAQALADGEREELRRLLAGSADDDGSTAATAALDADIARVAAGSLAAGRVECARDLTERVGDAVGPYTLLEVLGEGGFGVVYLAERREPMVQRVALKVIKPGMDTRAVVARFEQERQALAVMDHPNVARVFDGGVTASGRPYFVMEHVDGESITAFADARKLTLRQRLELFIPVCEAVQHAHHKGLVHRDLKPSNVLVAEVEGGAVPKVIDFGVAKAIASEDWANTAHTQSGMVIGTPLYMSPEQVAGETDVDTRADVYSLGVMLYELLTGEVPLDAAMLRRQGLAEVQRIIREVTPPKPSTRLAQLADHRSTAIAQARSSSRERISGELRRELDWIPLMALRKERERRYESPQALADDVRRYLDGRPLRAAPESRAYLVRKFVRRNRVQVAAAAAVFLALTAGLVLALWQRSEAIRARDAEAEQRAEATAARDAEKQRADQLKKVSDFQSAMLVEIDTTKAGLDLMKDVCERFEMALDKAGVPEAERHARVDALRQELVRVNATDAAAAMLDRTILSPAVKTIDAQFKDDPATDASLRQALASLYSTIGLYDAAYPLQASALAIRRRVLGEEHPETLTSVGNMGVLLRDQGRLAEAEPYHREALEKSRRTLGEEHPDTLVFINNMGGLLRSQGRLAEAESYLSEALGKFRRTFGAEHPYTLTSIGSMGVLLQDQGRLAEAEPYHREALEKSRRTLGEDHSATLGAVSNMGRLLLNLGRLAEAEPYVREALETRRRVLGEEHPNTLDAIDDMGKLLRSQGKLAEAEPYVREALEKRRRALGEEHPATLRALGGLALFLHAQGRPGEAEPYVLQAIEAFRRVHGEDHPDTLALTSNVGSILQAQGRLAEAERYQREVLERSHRRFGEDHPITLVAAYSMLALQVSQRRAQEALELALPYEPAARRAFAGGNSWRLADFLLLLGRARVALGFDGEGFTLAEVNLLEAHQINLGVKDRGSSHKNTRACVQVLVDLYSEWDKAAPGQGYDAKAADWRAKLDVAVSRE
jgi:serine/threonine protein kinase/Tfp pilus assembly protein PilF